MIAKGLANRRLQPLGHLSGVRNSQFTTVGMSAFAASILTICTISIFRSNERPWPLRPLLGSNQGAFAPCPMLNAFLRLAASQRWPLVSCPGDFVNTDSLLRVGVSPTKWSG